MKESIIRWASKKPKFIIIVESAVLFLLTNIFCLYEFGIEKTYKLAGMLTPIAVMGVTAYFARNQLELGREQKALAQRQATTAHTKLKLDLFDKRYDAYKNIVEHFAYCYDLPLSMNHYYDMTSEEEKEYSSTLDRRRFMQMLYDRAYKKIEDIKRYNDDSKTKREIDLNRIKFLYNDHIHMLLFKFSYKSHELLNHEYLKLHEMLAIDFNSYVYLSESTTHNISDIIEERVSLARELLTTITDAMRPFLHVPDQ